MKLDNCLKIYDYLAESDGTGKPVLTIARELDIPPQEVKACLGKFSDSFVRVGGAEKYTINKFNDGGRALLERELKKNKKGTGYVFWMLIFISIFSSLVTVLSTR